MISTRTNWMFCFFLPLAAGITIGLAFFMQMVVSMEFEASETEIDTSHIKTIEIPYICDCAEENPTELPPRDLYQTLPSPVRLEPDKTCEARLARRPMIGASHIGPNNLWIFDPERARRLERLNREQEERDKQDTCPLIPKP